MALLPDIADGVVAALQAGTFDPPLAVERRNVPRVDADRDFQGDAPLAIVAPAGTQYARVDRGHETVEAEIAVLLVRRVDLADEQVQTDAVLALAEAVIARLRVVGRFSYNGTVATYRGAQQQPPLDDEALGQHGEAVSVIFTTWRATATG